MSERTRRESALIEYYDQEAALGLRTDLGPLRRDLRLSFSALLRNERRSTIVDVGAGPGRDATEFAADGLRVVGVDLGPANIAQLRASGIPGCVASVLDLPFSRERFDAVWTMSTLVHVPDADLDRALSELLVVAPAGAPVGIGTWGGFDWEGVSDRDTITPARFFALRAHDRMRTILESHATVERFETHHPNPDSRWEYQFAVVRR